MFILENKLCCILIANLGSSAQYQTYVQLKMQCKHLFKAFFFHVTSNIKYSYIRIPTKLDHPKKQTVTNLQISKLPLHQFNRKYGVKSNSSNLDQVMRHMWLPV